MAIISLEKLPQEVKKITSFFNIIIERYFYGKTATNF